MLGTTYFLNHLKAALGLLLVFIFPFWGTAQIEEAFNTPGTSSWEVPCGVTSITVHLYGGGGGGGGSNSGGLGGGGGGAGGYASWTFPVTPGDLIPYTIGGGGSAGGPAGNGGPGGQTNLNPFSGLRAFGGTGGLCENSGAIGGTGGTGSGWATNATGNDGNDGNTTGVGIGGHGGNNQGPHGGAAGLGGSSGLNGSNASPYGSGGGGGGEKSGSANPSGGTGSNGAVVFEYNSTVTMPNAGNDVNLCGLTNLSGNTPDAGWTGTWSVVAGSASVTSPNSPTSGFTGLASGSCATFRWTFTMGGCKTVYDDVTICKPAICNDDPCGAINIPVNLGSCSYTQYSNAGSTASTGMVEPGCGSYLDNDVWFSLTVPANGQVTLNGLDNGAPGSVYPAIAVYEGSCDNLTHAGCDQTTSTLIPSELTYNGTPGSTIYVRVWDYLDSENGFGLCAWTHVNPAGNVLPGSTTVTCGTPMVFMDGGGTGNYSNNSGGFYEICPDTPGQYVSIDFSTGFFSTYSSLDALTILDGAGTDATVINQWFGNNNPGVVTSSDPSGCLTVVFQANASNVSSGWLADVNCSAVPGVHDTLCSPQNCSGGCGQWICLDGVYPTGNNGGGIEDLGVQNSGCFVGVGEIASHWFYFQILEGGTIEFAFDGPNGQDYDFAVWGPSNDGVPPCPQSTGESPIRCSWAAVGNTSNPVGLNGTLGAGEYYEGVEGNGWVDALNVQAGEVYAMVLNIFMNGNPQPVIDLTIGGTGTIDCAPVLLPVEFHSIQAINQGDKNFVSWITSSERDNDYFTLERSANGFDWEYAGTVEGSGTTMDPKYYSLHDYQPHAPVTYYRVKQTDFDGKVRYSEVVSVNLEFELDGMVISEIFPNPAKDHVTFSYNGTAVSKANPLNLQVVDERGQVVMNYNFIEIAVGAPSTLGVGQLAAGTYQLVATQGEFSNTQKLVIIK